MNKEILYSKYRWVVLLIGCLVLISYTIDTVAFVPIFGEIAKELKVDMGAVINLATAFGITMCFGIIFGGMICDRYGITFVFVLGLLCASVPAALMPWIGHSYEIVFIARLIQGAVVMAFATIGPILALWFPPKEQGLAGGIMMSSISIGLAIGMVASPAIFSAIGSWQKTVAILSIPGWITMVLALLLTRNSPSLRTVNTSFEKVKSNQQVISYRQALLSPLTWVGVFVVFFNTWGLYGLLNLVPPYLATEAPMGLGLGLMMAGKISLALTLIGIPAFVFGGVFFDRVAYGKARPAVLIGFIMTGIFTYLLILPEVCKNITLIVVCLIIAGWGTQFIGPSISAFIAMNYPPYLVGRMVGWWFGFGSFGGVVGTYLGGMATSKFGNFVWAFIPVSFACVAGFILGFFLKTKRIEVGLIPKNT